MIAFYPGSVADTLPKTTSEESLFVAPELMEKFADGVLAKLHDQRDLRTTVGLADSQLVQDLLRNPINYVLNACRALERSGSTSDKAITQQWLMQLSKCGGDSVAEPFDPRLHYLHLVNTATEFANVRGEFKPGSWEGVYPRPRIKNPDESGAIAKLDADAIRQATAEVVLGDHAAIAPARVATAEVVRVLV